MESYVSFSVHECHEKKDPNSVGGNAFHMFFYNLEG